MKYFKYITLSLFTLAFFSCENDQLDDLRSRGNVEPIVLEDFNAGDLNVSKFVAIGNSLTAGFADNALYKVSQVNSTPAIMAQQFAAVANGGVFTQPLMNDNVGGLLANSVQLPGFGPRLVFDGSGPVPQNSLNPFAVSTTDIVLNNPTGPFNNLGVPGAKSFHLLAPGYGNIVGTGTTPPTANPYFVRMASSPGTSILADAIAQQPTFISLWIGNNDVLGYATSGGDGSNPITPLAGAPGVGFEQTYLATVGSLVAGIPGVQGILANIPDVTSIPFFTTVPHNPVPLDGATAGALNTAYAAYNGGLSAALANSLISQEEFDQRVISFSESDSNAMVIEDEYLTVITLPGPVTLPNIRQATSDDLFTLPLLSLIPNGFGTQTPVPDTLSLLPQEQAEISNAVTSYNTVIANVAAANNFALFDANARLFELANGGIETSGLILTSDFVTGGAFSLDGVHPNSRGYALVANLMLQAIDDHFGSNFEASGNLVDVSTYNTNYSAALTD